MSWGELATLFGALGALLIGIPTVTGALTLGKIPTELDGKELNIVRRGMKRLGKIAADMPAKYKREILLGYFFGLISFALLLASLSDIKEPWLSQGHVIFQPSQYAERVHTIIAIYRRIQTDHEGRAGSHWKNTQSKKRSIKDRRGTKIPRRRLPSTRSMLKA